MAIGRYPEGSYRVTGADDITRGGGRISGNMNPSQEYLLDPNLPVLSTNNYWGSKHRGGQVQIGIDTIVGLLSTQQSNDMGYKKPVLTVCNGESTTATDSNGYTREGLMRPCGTMFKHGYKSSPGRFDQDAPSIDRGQYMVVPYFADPFQADQCWLGAAVGGSTTSLGDAALNGLGVAYSSDARLGAGMDPRNPGTMLCSDHKGHFRKWVSGTDPDYMRIAEVHAFEEMPYSGMLAWTMINPNGVPTMWSENDIQRPYALPSGKDPRAFLAHDKDFYQANYGENESYLDPVHLTDGNGIAGLTDGSRVATKSATETFANVAVANSKHTIQLTYKPVCRSEQGAVNPNASAPYPSEVTVQWDSTNGNDFSTGNAANIKTLREDIDYSVNRYKGIISITSNMGTSIENTNDYKITYNYLDNQVAGVPTNADWNGCSGLLYVITYFNR